MAIGVGSNTDPTTGEDFPDWHDPNNVYAGGRCNRGSSQITTGADGRQYVCIANTWVLFTGVGGNQASTQSATPLPGGGLLSSGTAPTQGGRAQLTIVSEGDDTLQRILEEVSYNAFIEVIS